MADPIVVTGATGFVGSRLVEALVALGYDVRAMTRHPERYEGSAHPVGADVNDATSLSVALAGASTAYYLVHSLDNRDFEQRDARAAENFAAAARQAGVRHIIYLGGLGDADGRLSPHLRSRRQVESILSSTGVPVTVLRAAIVVGNGGVSWEITRQLVKNLPVMVTPRWVNTRTQPIALPDAVRYLVAALDHPGLAEGVFEIGGPDVLTYAEMLRRAGRLRNGRSVPLLVVPLLTPRLSSLWISLVTDVDTMTARNLIDSMSTEVVVRDHSIESLVPGHLATYDEAVEQALAERHDRRSSRRR